MIVCVCVCVKERETKRERESVRVLEGVVSVRENRETHTHTVTHSTTHAVQPCRMYEGLRVCARVCVRERERERERERGGGSVTHSTGCRRSKGCRKLRVIFGHRATNYRALWRKITYKNKASYGSSPPCMGWLRLVGSFKLYISLENIGLFYRALLQKRPII